jgi:hypothetical protein
MHKIIVAKMLAYPDSGYSFDQDKWYAVSMTRGADGQKHFDYYELDEYLKAREVFLEDTTKEAFSIL